MILFYVYGSGLGHLTRVIKYIQVEKIAFSSCIVLTNSKHIERLPIELRTLQYPDSFFKDHQLFHSTLTEIINDYSVDEIVVDVFPCGFYGELHLIDQLNLKTTLLARIIKPVYFEGNTSPLYSTLLVVEKGIELENYRYKNTRSICLSTADEFIEERLEIQKPFFYILHSEPIEEVLQLYKLAKLHQKNGELIYIQTICDTMEIGDENVIFIFNKKPLLSLLEKAVTIFTASGFNTFHATEKYRQKQYFLPFERRFDDQFNRIKHYV